MRTSACKLLLLVGCLVAPAHCGWGGWNEVRRVADNVGREVQNAVKTVGREAERIGSQVETVYHEAVQEVKKVPDEVESWFVPSGGGGGGEPEPEEPGVTHVRRRGCRPLLNDTVDFSCILDGRRADCKYPQAVGTVATISCKPGYKVTEYPGFSDITCTDKFVWSKQYFLCVPDCGKRNAKTENHVTWNVGVFQRDEHNDFKQTCAGSLISQTLVLSAASCFWDTENHSAFNASKYRLLAGNLHREYATTDAWAQRRDVAAVVLGNRFAGRVRSLASDVAVVKVTEPFLVTPGVNTVCLDWINAPTESAMENGDKGLVASWAGSNTDKEISTALKLSFVSFDSCVDTVDTDFAEYLTFDKICASADNPGTDITVCSVDTGVGYAFPLQTLQGQRYYLRGVASEPFNATGCGPQKRALFTRFSSHLKWAQDVAFQNTA